MPGATAPAAAHPPATPAVDIEEEDDTDVTRTKTLSLLAAALALAGVSLGGKWYLEPQSTPAVDGPATAARIVASLAERCPMTTPGDVPAFDTCRATIGQGPEGEAINTVSVLRGGEQPTVELRNKNLTWFRGDLFLRMYVSLYMFTGQWSGEAQPDGSYVIRAQAYFRNELPPGHFPYPFWHSAPKWDAYEKSNELRLTLSRDGRVRMVTRHDRGSESARPVAYRRVEPPVFAGQWNWTDQGGQAQPVVTLFSDLDSAGNPHLPALDQRYRAFTLNMRDADCESCHVPDGHKYMRRLSLLNTPLHTAGEIDATLRSIRESTMPVNKQGDRVRLDPGLRDTMLRKGEEFRRLLLEADAWERANNTGRVVPASAARS
jgi:hypothetical protein